MRRRIQVLMPLIFLIGCEASGVYPSSNEVTEDFGHPMLLDTNLTADAENFSTDYNVVDGPAPIQRANYEDREGTTYHYVTAVSEEERQRGRAVGSVLSFQYLGQRGGRHIIAQVDGAGRPFKEFECATPCRIIVSRFRGQVERTPFSSRSIIGGAFEDAISGRLEVHREEPIVRNDLDPIPRPNIPSSDVRIPLRFIGEWNTDLSHCGTGLNDTRLRIEPHMIRFYESDAEVVRIENAASRSIVVEAEFEAEGRRWTQRLNLVLSASGEELSIEGFARQRCPG